MNCDRRDSRPRGLLWPIMLAAVACLASAGCGGATQWLASDGQPKVGTRAFEEQVAADPFPAAAEVGL
jgi:hypothetical protein